MDTLIGQTIAHYKILVKIGEDATGTVYKAQDTEADRFVAIKTLSPSITANPERRQRVERDAMAASALEHPNIARVYEFSRAGDVEFAVMEAPEGECAYDLLHRERPHRRQLLLFASQMADALEAAHAAGIIHGPLNPQAIFISPKNQIKFHDFGFGALDPAPESEEARRHSFGASAPYVSPEQIGGACPDIRSDIFSLGAMLYRMTTGRRTFRGATISDTWKAILEEEPKPIAQVTRRAPKGMDKLVDRCLGKNPQRRFQQVGEIQPLLQKIADDYYQNPDHQASSLSRNRGRIAKVAGLALAATAAVAGAVIWWQSRPVEEPVLGKHLRQVTKNAGYDTEPTISKDGRWLAYTSDRGSEGNLDIWVQPADGGEPRQLTSDPAGDREPAFSPDGETIAFRSERNGGGVYLVPSKRGDARLIAPEGRRPRYSPDGRWIAYWVAPAGFPSKPNGAYKIFVVPAEGGAPRQIRPDFASAAFPIWSPDSKSVLFLGRSDASRTGANSMEWWVSAVEREEFHDTGALWLLRSNGILPEGQLAIPGDWKGNHVVFSIPVIQGSNIWRADIASESRAVSRPLRVTSGKSRANRPLLATTASFLSIRSTTPTYGVFPSWQTKAGRPAIRSD